MAESESLLNSRVAVANEAFSTLVDLRPGDWDRNGHLGHLAYLDLAEVARVRHMHAAGFALPYLVASRRGLVILDLRVRYLKEVRADVGSLELLTTLAPLGRKTLAYEQAIRYAGDSLCELEFTMGLLDLDSRRLRLDPIAELEALADACVADLGHDRVELKVGAPAR